MTQLNLSAARFALSAAKLAQLPPDEGAEVAFGGRSNAGKSSALNRLTNQKKLARTSKTPGRTQLINVFPVTPTQRLIDLPGYGFAKVPEAMKAGWGELIANYFEQRRSLRGLVLLMDIRHPLKDSDILLSEWCADNRLPVHFLLTKSDKMSRGAGNNQLLRVRQEIPRSASVQLFSALKGTGLPEAREVISSWLSPETAADISFTEDDYLPA